MQLKIIKSLFDIQASIFSIFDFSKDCQNFSDYDKNNLIKRGVEREFEIIGEAINRIMKIDPAIEITNARKIVNLRNWVIHSYDNVDSIIIWTIVKRDLPVLQDEVKQLIQKYQ
jgi:uncharacterized protein with HEPN domain